MQRIFGRKAHIKESELARFETYLQSAFQPIKPRADFVIRLKGRLMTANVARSRWLNLNVRQTTGLVLASILCCWLIVVTGVRVALAIIGAIGLLRYSKDLRQKQSEELQPVSYS